ncbi:ABC transporter permease [Deinococcus gobiensis]|uniref:ABC transporter permease n=1 Tax=Deinococcus gobiensis TaxID=502394 RepID=UPI0014614D84|nr:ABC transporter permease subunit [Deinococcus gobiensis]
MTVPGRLRPALTGPVSLGLGVALCAEAAARLGWVAPYILPAPSAVLAALWRSAPDLARHAAQTLLETGLGLAAAAVLGAGAALALHRLPALQRAALPWLVVSQTVPLVALAPLLLLTLGFGLLPKVLLVLLGSFFPVAVSTLDGLSRADPDLLRVTASLGASPGQLDRLVRWPSALPSFFSGLKVAATYAVPTAIFSEYLGAYAGLGYVLQTSVNARATDLMFAAVAVCALLSVGLVALTTALSRRVLRWLPPQPPF